MTLYSKRKRFAWLSEEVGKHFSKAGLSPNQWTFLSVPFSILSGYFLSQAGFLLGGIFLITASFLDLVDGAVARDLGRESRKGAYLETLTDRYVEGLVLFGLLFAALPDFLIPAYAWIFLFLFGGMMTTYAKSAAKEKRLVRDELKGGILERAERLLILLIGILLAIFDPVYLTYTIALLSALANISALQRMRIAYKTPVIS